jgi:hypothetical protein
MQWYLAKLVFQIICGDGNHRPQFDEQLRLHMQKIKKLHFAKAGNLAAGKNKFSQTSATNGCNGNSSM